VLTEEMAELETRYRLLILTSAQSLLGLDCSNVVRTAVDIVVVLYSTLTLFFNI